MANLKSVSRFSTFSGRINLVPMIDIVFQLIVFFMVASHLAMTGRELIRIPQPTQSQARVKSLTNPVVINLVADASGHITKIKANSDLVRDLPALVDLLLRYGPTLANRKGTITLRADKDIHFAEIEQVLQAIGSAGITSVHIAAELNPQPGPGTK